MSKDKPAETDEDAARRGKRKLILILAAVLLAAAGAAYFFLMPGDAAAAEEPVPGEVLALEPVAVNLAGGGYLKIGIALQLSEDAAGHGGGPDGSHALDLIIATFSQAQPADVTGARDALKEALEEKIVEAYHGDVIEIFYTEYVTQ
jgi:flagellar FliL protein